MHCLRRTLILPTRALPSRMFHSHVPPRQPRFHPLRCSLSNGVDKPTLMIAAAASASSNSPSSLSSTTTKTDTTDKVTKIDAKERTKSMVARKRLNCAGKLFEIWSEEHVQRRTDGLTGLFKSGPGRVVLFAIVVNGANVAAKSVAWWYTGSKSMFSEVMHSIADTCNQILVAYGLYSSQQKPDETHPYGYTPMRNVSSLISGVAIFFLGAGLTFYHGVQGVLEPHDVEPLHWALLVMLGSFLSEGCTLVLAYREAKRGAKRHKFDSVRQWLLSGIDPSTSVVLLEDLAAVMGVLVAGTAMSITALTGHPLPDAVGAIGVSAILAGVAALIIHTNTDMLLGRAIPPEEQEAIMRLIDNVKIIRGTYDIKATMIGGEAMRFKAEVDIDGRELTRRYMESLSLELLLQEVQSIKSEQQLVHFMLKHGDNLVNTLGAEINQIEEKIKKEFPTMKHIDIEIN